MILALPHLHKNERVYLQSPSPGRWRRNPPRTDHTMHPTRPCSPLPRGAGAEADVVIALLSGSRTCSPLPWGAGADTPRRDLALPGHWPCSPLPWGAGADTHLIHRNVEHAQGLAVPSLGAMPLKLCPLVRARQGRRSCSPLPQGDGAETLITSCVKFNPNNLQSPSPGRWRRNLIFGLL